MKLERLHESVFPTLVLIGGLCFAVFVGSLAGNGRTGMVGLAVLTIAAAVILLIARERVWMLIPAVWMLGGKILILPLPFSVAHLGVLYAFGSFLLLKAFKVVRLKPKFGLVEFWMLVVLIYLVSVFIRNPVGVEALGSERVGGRPYFNIGVACAAFWVLSRSITTSREAFYLPLLVVAGHGLQTLVNVIAYRIPSTAGLLSSVYSGIEAAEELDAASSILAENSGRKGYWAGIGSSVFSVASSYWRPFTLINPLFFGRFLIFLFAVSALLISGFRSAVFAMLLTFLVSSYFRRGAVEAFKAVLLGIVSLGLLLLMHGTIFDLPLSAQRTLSFLPGKWDYSAKREAQGSTEWRMVMWKAIMAGNKYIENKWLGDGFGFTRQQFQIMQANTRSGVQAEMQENFLISGSVHSGPISTIRFVGYVGLALFLVLMFLVAARGVRLIRRAEGTAFFSLALFVCIPSILHPAMFIFIFGAYENDLPAVVMSIGMQKMLENSLDAHVASTKESAATPLAPLKRFRRPPQMVPA